MSRVTTTWGVAVGALVGLGVASHELFRWQARAARRVIGKPLGEVALEADRTYKKKYGDRVELLVLGDSIAAGLGADQPEHTLGGQLAKRLAKATHRAVRLHTGACVGAETSMVRAQVAALPPGYRADVAVIVVGGNDVTHRVRPSVSGRHLAEVIEELQAHGTEVVVGTCPDLGALAAVPQPLRAFGGLAARQLATHAARRRDPPRGVRRVAGRRGGSLLHRPARRDVRRRPIPPLGRWLPAHRQGAVAQRAGGTRPRRGAAARPPPAGATARRGRLGHRRSGPRARPDRRRAAARPPRPPSRPPPPAPRAARRARRAGPAPGSRSSSSASSSGTCSSRTKSEEMAAVTSAIRANPETMRTAATRRPSSEVGSPPTNPPPVSSDSAHHTPSAKFDTWRDSKAAKAPPASSSSAEARTR